MRLQRLRRQQRAVRVRAEEDVDYNYVLRYLPLYTALLTDDWETAETIFNEDPDSDTAIITKYGQTTLHIAVRTNRSHRFVENLVDRIADKDITKLRTRNSVTLNSLHYAAKAGNTKAAMALVKKDPEMTLIADKHGNTAVTLAAWYGRKDTLEYLSSVTPNVIGGPSPYCGKAGGDLITLTIMAGFYDVALTLVNKYPNLVTEKNRNGHTALQILATCSNAFPSGRSWWFWQHLIYSYIPLNNTAIACLDAKIPTSEKKPLNLRRKTKILLRPAWLRYVPWLKSIHDKKLEYKQTNQLMKDMVTMVLNVGEHSVVWDVLGTAVSTAAKHGIYELVEECVRRYPDLIWCRIEGLTLFSAAIKYRQVKVYNLFYQMNRHEDFVPSVIPHRDTVLHLTGRKASPHRLNTVTGAALQMQRELQWFKELEKFVQPSFKKALNEENKTPRMVFTDEHKELLEKGEKWMKDTATSSMIVATLIVTVTFTAIFTVPGGNKEENGIPHFLNDSAFAVFFISDAVALFSSVTSVLMFLTVLTSSYSEDDFLYALPKRITVGLLALFISIAALMVTFCAALVIVMKTKWWWTAIPVALTACVPILFFGMLQFPLLVELVVSTYGPSIFRKQGN